MATIYPKNGPVESFPFFSILTATLDNEATLRWTLESVKNQTFQSFEHIVIDGDSHDRTTGILKQFSGTYNLTWISEPDTGIADALNKGLALSHGYYILVIQGDDRLSSVKTLYSIYNLLRASDIDIYCCPVIYDPPVRGRGVGKPISLLWWNRFRNILPHQGVFVNRSVFDRIGRFDERFSISMDYDFFYRAMISRCRIKFGKTPVAIVGGTGLSSNDSFIPKRLREEFCVQNKNETNYLWRIGQFIFQLLYFPYKIRILPFLKNHFKGKGLR
jgi:glycosyltransferase involved in cell wall biosynthesis